MTHPQYTQKVIDRFWSKVDRSGGADACWIWQGGCARNGYGRFSIGYQGYFAHRLAFVLGGGVIGDGLYVCHRCDNRRCVNPAHLFTGTHQDNMDDMLTKGRNARGDTHGMRLHPESAPTGSRNGSRKHPERLRRGATHPMSTVTEDVVRALRAYHESNPSVSYTELGKTFGVSKEHAWNIVSRRRWAHVV